MTQTKRGWFVFSPSSICIFSCMVYSHAFHLVPAPLSLPPRLTQMSLIPPEAPPHAVPSVIQLFVQTVKACEYKTRLTQCAGVHIGVEHFLEKTRRSIYAVVSGAPALPACLRPEGSEAVRSSLMVGRKRGASRFLQRFLSQLQWSGRGAEAPACKCHICLSTIFAWLNPGRSKSLQTSIWRSFVNWICR